MPTVRKPNATSVVRRTSASQPSPKRPVTSAAIANENGIVKPDVARVEDRRVDRDERMVLEQRVRALAVERDRARAMSLNGLAGNSIKREEEARARASCTSVAHATIGIVGALRGSATW